MVAMGVVVEQCGCGCRPNGCGIVAEIAVVGGGICGWGSSEKPIFN